MKNWKYINGAEVGNSDLSTSRLKDIEEQIKNWEHAIDKVEGIDKEKAKKILEGLRKERAELRSKTGNSDGVARMFQGLVKDEDKDEKHYEGAIDDLEKVGNASKIYQHKLYPNKYVVVDEDKAIYTIITDGKVEKTGEYNMAVDKGISQIYKRVSSMNSKTGNAKDKNDKDIKVGDFVNVTGKKGKVTRIISDDVVEVFFDNSGTDYPDRTDRYYASQCTKIGNKVGNAKSIWELPDGSRATVKEDGTVEIKKKGDSSLYVYKVWDKERAERQLERKGAKKVGNSASEDKFAYVMREFEEGKLKSSSGETVTDPAQAKAIAYSESKKAENGLARARKAIH